jgi:hypothetical protein
MIKGQVNETEQQCVDGLLFEVVSGAGYSIPQRCKDYAYPSILITPYIRSRYNSLL